MPTRILQVATWILCRLVPEEEREALVGDLMEEYVLRLDEASSPAPLNWYLRQVCASLPPLLWARFARARWASTLGVALLAYIVIGAVEYIANWAMSRWLVTGTATYTPLELLVTVPTVMFIGHSAARIRRSAALVLGVMMLLVVTAMTVWTTESMPLWYRIVYFFVGPAAAFSGGALRSAAVREVNFRHS